MSTVSDQQPFSPAFAGAEAIDAGTMRSASVRTVSWPLWIVLTLFWIYVTLSNVLYTHFLSLALDPADANHYFSDWDVRVLQHVFLYPILLGAIWASLRLG